MTIRIDFASDGSLDFAELPTFDEFQVYAAEVDRTIEDAPADLADVGIRIWPFVRGGNPEHPDQHDHKAGYFGLNFYDSGDADLLAWTHSPKNLIANANLNIAYSRELLRLYFISFILSLEPTTKAEVDRDLARHVELFVELWRASADSLPLSADDRRIADALSVLAMEASMVADPPRDVLRATFRWFGQRLNDFSGEFAKTAGKTAGTAAAVGAGVAISGQLPSLVSVVERVLHALH